jgi:hypothetical protein
VRGKSCRPPRAAGSNADQRQRMSPEETREILIETTTRRYYGVKPVQKVDTAVQLAMRERLAACHFCLGNDAVSYETSAHSPTRHVDGPPQSVAPPTAEATRGHQPPQRASDSHTPGLTAGSFSTRCTPGDTMLTTTTRSAMPVIDTRRVERSSAVVSTHEFRSPGLALGSDHNDWATCQRIQFRR